MLSFERSAAMSKKHFYITFDDSVPSGVVKKYNQMVRQQEHRYEKDALGKAIFFGNEDELYKLNIVRYISDIQSHNEETYDHEEKLKQLKSALKQLKEKYPLEYEVVMRHYFMDKPQSVTQIAKEKNTYPQKITRILKRAYKHLKYCGFD